jgi:hypothetical protein
MAKRCEFVDNWGIRITVHLIHLFILKMFKIWGLHIIQLCGPHFGQSWSNLTKPHTQSSQVICSTKQHKSKILYYVTPEAYWFRSKYLGAVEVWEHQTCIAFTDKNVWKRELLGRVPYTIGWRKRIVTEMTPNSNPTLPSVLESIMCMR